MFFRLITLGCKVNQYETEWLREGFYRLGWTESPDAEPAAVVVVNTCTVTAESDLKSRKLVRKAIKENPNSQVFVIGCSVTRDAKPYQHIDGVTEIIADKRHLPDFLHRLGLEYSDIPTGIERFGERHRAYVKIQDGCQVGCSYCVIPKVRPRLESRPQDDIVAEINRLLRNGYREIVLTGIHLGHYGVETGTPKLAPLLRKLALLPDLASDDPFRIRLSSLEAVEVTDDLIEVLASYPKRFCPHFHLPMQSGSDTVLRRMKRRWLSEPFYRVCEKLKNHPTLDRAALTTDLIVGFPGETDVEFDETCRLLDKIRFSKIHVFRYSPRAGTEAATMPHRVPPKVQKERAAYVTGLAQKYRNEYSASLVGMSQSVLIERTSGGTSDRYLDVEFPAPVAPSMIGKIVYLRHHS